MDKLLNMGFSEDLASQALTATGGKSVLKATEWILTQKPEIQKAQNSPSSTKAGSQQQLRVDRFFQGSQKTPSSKDESVPSEHSRVHPSVDTADCDYIVKLGVANSQEYESLPSKDSSEAEPFSKRQKTEARDSSSQIKPSVPFRFSPPSLQKGSTKSISAAVPLAERMRPVSVDDVVGQDHLLGKNSILRSLLECDRLPSIIFWGPPGTGKTSLAKAIASSVSYRFTSMSAVTSGLKEVREVLEEAKRMRNMGRRTLFFVDEVHRFNKAQQDAFLPVIEDGSIVFFGATTENPSFEVNNALLSRCRVFTLNKLQPEDVRKLLERAISDTEKGLAVSLKGGGGPFRVCVDENAMELLSCSCDGDARIALNALEIAASAAVAAGRDKHQLGLSGFDNRNDGLVKSFSEKCDSSVGDPSIPFKKFEGGREMVPYTPCKSKDSFFATIKKIDAGYSPAVAVSDSEGGPGPSNAYKSSKRNTWNIGGQVPDGGTVAVIVTLNHVKEALQCKNLNYDKTGEEHYNIISALHKSMRGSDADAALYWLARMLEGGENPLYIARRLIRFASEDVGLADPSALTQAVSCYQACHFLGMPECNVNLAQCVAYLSLAPKSVAVYKAIEAAQMLVKERGHSEPVPLHLRNAPTKLMKDLGYGNGYIYPPSHFGRVEQQYLPSSLLGYKFLNWPE